MAHGRPAKPRAARLDTGLLNRPHSGESAVQPLVGQVGHGRTVLAQAAAHQPRTAARYRLLHVDSDGAAVGEGRGQPPAVVGDAHVQPRSVDQPGRAAPRRVRGGRPLGSARRGRPRRATGARPTVSTTAGPAGAPARARRRPRRRRRSSAPSPRAWTTLSSHTTGRAQEVDQRRPGRATTSGRRPTARRTEHDWLQHDHRDGGPDPDGTRREASQ
jgi:hypothetical protein